MPQKVTGKRKATGEPKRSGGSSEDAAEPELLGKESEAESNNKSSKRQKSRPKFLHEEVASGESATANQLKGSKSSVQLRSMREESQYLVVMALLESSSFQIILTFVQI